MNISHLNNWRGSKNYILLVILCGSFLFALLYRLGSFSLMLEEPYRALVGLEFLLNDDLIVRRAFGLADTEKTPLWNLVLACFGSLSGWSAFGLRLPAVITTLFLGLVILRWVKEETGNVKIAFASSALVLISRQILLFSSFLAEIDLFHATLIFTGQILFHLNYQKKEYTRAYVSLYSLGFLAFFSWGIPSILHIFLSLFFYSIWKQNTHPVFCKQHILGITIFISAISIHLVTYANIAPVVPYLNGLLEAVYQRVETVPSSGFLDHVIHLISFPLQLLLVDTFPSSVLFIGVFFKAYRKLLLKHPFNRFCLSMIAANMFIYLLTPEARPRYVQMCFPYFIAALTFTYFSKSSPSLPKLLNRLIKSLSILFIICVGTIPIWGKAVLGREFHTVDFLILLLAGTLALVPILIRLNYKLQWFWYVLFLMVGIRICFSQLVLTQKDYGSPRKERLTLAQDILSTFPDRKYFVYGKESKAMNYLSMSTIFQITKSRLEVIRKVPDIKKNEKAVYFIFEEDLNLFLERGYSVWKNIDYRGKRVIVFN